MLLSLGLVASLVVLGGAAPAGQPAPARERWGEYRLVVRGKLAAVYVEPVLGRRPDRPKSFFLSLMIRNLGDKPIGLDGPGLRWFIHPNQWSIGDQPTRTAVDERTLVPLPLGPQRAGLRARLRKGTITTLPPGSSLQTDVEFEGAGPAELTGAPGRFLIVSFDGQLFVTDGTSEESLSAKADGQTAADLALPLPLRWKDVEPPSVK